MTPDFFHARLHDFSIYFFNKSLFKEMISNQKKGIFIKGIKAVSQKQSSFFIRIKPFIIKLLVYF